MPIVGIKKAILDKRLMSPQTEEEFDELCFDYGLELDEVTSEKKLKERELRLSTEGGEGGGGGESLTENLSDEMIYKIELPANRYDLLCAEGLTRALLVFKKQLEIPRYWLSNPGNLQRMVVKQPTQQVRPFVVAAVLRDVQIDADAYASLIDLQDKLHQNLCRKRTLVAIGTHDLDTIRGPFVYTAKEPKEIKFRALNQDKGYTAAELMDLYSTDSHLRHYLPIIRDEPLYPVIFDSDGVVLSMPPIINGDHSKLRTNTRNVFIESTATDLTKAKVVLDTIVTMFSEYCRNKFEIEPVEVEQVDGSVTIYPELMYRKETASVANINSQVGINVSAEEMADLLTRMCLKAEVIEGGEKLSIEIPPTRHDIIHECDIVEDVAIAYGYNNIGKQLPASATIASQFAINKLTDSLRIELAACGYTEALTFSLCSRDDVSTKLKQANGTDLAVKIANPKTVEFQVARTTLLPGILKTIAFNKDISLPLKLFEVQDVVYKDANYDTGAKNERRLCAVYYGKTSGFEAIHGLLDRVMQLLNRTFSNTQPSGYFIRPSNDGTFFGGRCAEVVVLLEEKREQRVVGKMGILHPDVVSAFDLNLPTSALELNIHPFL